MTHPTLQFHEWPVPHLLLTGSWDLRTRTKPARSASPVVNRSAKFLLLLDREERNYATMRYQSGYMSVSLHFDINLPITISLLVQPLFCLMNDPFFSRAFALSYKNAVTHTKMRSAGARASRPRFCMRFDSFDLSFV